MWPIFGGYSVLLCFCWSALLSSTICVIFLRHVRLGPGPAQIWRLGVTCQQTTRLVATALARMRGRIHSTLPVIRRSAPINQFYQKFILLVTQHLALSVACCFLIHWGRDNMDAISQTTFWSAFSWMKMFEFRLKFHWSLFLRVQLTIFQHWFR